MTTINKASKGGKKNGMNRWLNRITAALCTLILLTAAIPYPSTAEEAPQADLRVQEMAAGKDFLAFLLTDGTVQCFGNTSVLDMSDLRDWVNMRHIAACGPRLLGVTGEGDVLLAGPPEEEPEEKLSGIREISASFETGYYLALDENGTVHLRGAQVQDSIRNIDGLTGVSRIWAMPRYAAALMEDGTARVFGRTEEQVEVLSSVETLICGHRGLIVRFRDGSTEPLGTFSFLVKMGEDPATIAGVAESPVLGDVYARRDGTVGTNITNKEIAGEFRNWEHVVSLQCGRKYFAALRDDGTIYICGPDRLITEHIGDRFAPPPEAGNVKAVAAGYSHTLLLLADGTVRAYGKQDFHACDAEDWKGIAAIAAGAHFSAGLKTDGTVVVTDRGPQDSCDWRDITEIYAGFSYLVGKDREGRFHVAGEIGSLSAETAESLLNTTAESAPFTAVGGGCSTSHLTLVWGDEHRIVRLGSYEDMDAEKIRNWSGLAAVADGDSHTIGVLEDGTVVADGYNRYGQCDTDSLQDIVQAGCGFLYSIFLKTDGTVIGIGDNDSGACNTGGWKNVAAISVGGNHSVGLTADGLVLTAGSDSSGQCSIPSRYCAKQDNLVFTPDWRIYMDAWMYGQRNSESGWPNGFIVYDNGQSTSFGVNKAGLWEAFNWSGLCISLPRDGAGNADSIHIMQLENGDVLRSWRFFTDGTLRGVDQQKRVFEVDRADDLPEFLLPFAGKEYIVEIQERQEGKLHIGTYRITERQTGEEIFRMDAGPDGSVRYTWQGETVEYDAPGNRLTISGGEK